MAQGYFITFEGGEGAGKSTQLRRLAQRLEAAGREVVVTREPGGSPGAEAIRDLLVNGEVDRWSAMAETLLLYAARADHLQRVIRPGLERGAVVLCDRFSDSTRAYQGAAGGVGEGLINELERRVVGDASPDLTLILDLPPSEGLARAMGRGGAEARFEAKGIAFHTALREAFLSIARDQPARCKVIDASQPVEGVEQAVWGWVHQGLGRVGMSGI